MGKDAQSFADLLQTACQYALQCAFSLYKFFIPHASFFLSIHFHWPFSLSPLFGSGAGSQAYFHLTPFAVKLQPEAASVGSHQIVGLAIGRTTVLMRGTPAHAVAQTVLAKHQHSLGHRLFLERRINGL